ncbi:hypothetical protein EMIT0215P_150117 [Pseudomonas serboccidentalis]
MVIGSGLLGTVEGLQSNGDFITDKYRILNLLRYLKPKKYFLNPIQIELTPTKPNVGVSLLAMAASQATQR